MLGYYRVQTKLFYNKVPVGTAVSRYLLEYGLVQLCTPQSHVPGTKYFKVHDRKFSTSLLVGYYGCKYLVRSNERAAVLVRPYPGTGTAARRTVHSSNIKVK